MPDTSEPPHTASDTHKSHLARNCLFIAVVGFALIIGAIALVSATAKKAVNEMQPTDHDIEYIAGGTAGTADITYATDGSVSMSTANGRPLPWDKKLAIKGDFLNIYTLTVQNMNFHSNNATVTCEIKVDGTSVKKGEGTGPGAIADCSYTG